MSKYINLTETNKLIRRTLKEAFPTVKFSVRGKSYSGGSSTDIYWTDGPTVKQVQSYVDRFGGATFDGMTDLKSSAYVLFDGETTSFGPDYVFYNRDYSHENVRRSALAFRAQRGLDRISIDELIANEHNYEYCNNLNLKTSFIRKYMAERSRVMGKSSPTAERVQPWIDPEVAKQEQLEAQMRENRRQSEQYFDQLYKSDTTEPQPPVRIGDRLELAEPHLNKNRTIGEYVRQLFDSGDYLMAPCKVEKVANISVDEYDHLVDNLMSNITFIGTGGTDSDFVPGYEAETIFDLDPGDRELWQKQSYSLVTAICAPNRRTFFIDAQGYRYARYCLFYPVSAAEKAA